MKKLAIFTAEPKNFVPVELKKAGEALGLETRILDITHCFLTEGVSSDLKLISKIYCVTETGIEGIEFDHDTIVISRLNEYHLDIKLGMLKRIEALGAHTLNSSDSMQLCNDKLMSQVLLNTAGIKTPFTCTITNDADIEKIIKFIEDGERDRVITYPTILKTLHGTHGIGVMKVDSHASLVSIAQTLIKEDMDFMVQEFMEHDHSLRMIMIGDRVLAANERGQPKGKDEFRTNAHLGSETKAYTPAEEEIALGRRIVELFGCKFCAIDYLVRDVNGKNEIVILEVNGSPGLEGMQKDWPDRKLAEDVVRYAMGDDKPVKNVVVNPVPEQPAAEQPAEPEATSLPTDALNDIEPILIHRVFDQTVEARIDTGAKISSLHVDKISFDDVYAKFTRGDITYKVPVTRVIKIKNIHAPGNHSKRPVVRLDITIHGQDFNQVEFTLTDRSNMKYEVLIGRNILELLGLPVLVAKSDAVSPEGSAALDVEEE